MVTLLQKQSKYYPVKLHLPTAIRQYSFYAKINNCQSTFYHSQLEWPRVKVGKHLILN